MLRQQCALRHTQTHITYLPLVHAHTHRSTVRRLFLSLRWICLRLGHFLPTHKHVHMYICKHSCIPTHNFISFRKQLTHCFALWFVFSCPFYIVFSFLRFGQVFCDFVESGSLDARWGSVWLSWLIVDFYHHRWLATRHIAECSRACPLRWRRPEWVDIVRPPERHATLQVARAARRNRQMASWQQRQWSGWCIGSLIALWQALHLFCFCSFAVSDVW